MQRQIGQAVRNTFILLALFWLLFQTAYAMDVNGVIDTDSYWTTADSPINITGDLRVEADTTLIIAPGVEVIFQSSPDTSQGYSIRIDGTLTARGDQMDPIVFTAADPSNPWGAIMFSDESKDWETDTSTGSIIEYCVLEYGGNETDGAAMISLFNAMPLIARNAIRFGVSAGISALVSEDPATISSLSGKVRIISNLIYNNATGIRFTAEGGIIENNYFLNNNRAIDFQVRSNDIQALNNTIFSSAPELFGTGIRLLLDEAASGIAAYQWTQTAGPSVTLSNPQSARTAFIAPDPGGGVENLSFELTVTDKNGLQSTNIFEINITGDNPPPIARAGADGNVQLPQEEGEEIIVTLNGAGSSDPYLGIAGYMWEQTQGKTVVLENADTVTPTFTVPATVVAGDRMTFQLTVTDQGGLTSSDSLNIVYYDDNIFPVAAAGEDQTVSQGSPVVLNGTGSADPDGSISSYAWVQTDGPPVNLINSNTARPFFNAPADNTGRETLTFSLQVTDNGGLQATDDVSITVNSSLIANISASAPTSRLVILDGSASIDQNATASIDIERNILQSEDNTGASLLALSALENSAFKLNVTLNNFNAVNNTGYIVYTYNWSADAPSTIAIPDNWLGTTDAVVIEELIYDQDNNYKLPVVDYQPSTGKDIPGAGSSLLYPPLADAGPDVITDTDNSVILDGSASYDPDEIARYHWQQIDGPEVYLSSDDQAIAAFISPEGGADGTTLQFRLTVSTDNTFSHSDTVNVTVNPEENLPIVDADSCFLHSVSGNHKNNVIGIDLPGKILLFFIAVFAALFQLKRIFTTIVIVIATSVLIAVPAHAGYLAAGGGSGGDADEINFTIETGAKDIYAQNLNFLFGMGIFLIPHSDEELPSPTFSLPCPNDDCTRIGTVRKGTEIGFLGKFGVEIGSSDFYINAIGGFTAFTESELSQSPATDRTYEESSDSEIEALYGGGVSYFIDYKWDVVVQVDYDNIRGVTGTIGWHW